jgi:arginyl-tRNA synthetase
MAMELIKQTIKSAVKELFNADIDPELTRPDEQFGDYATNVALQLAGSLGKNPREVAEGIVPKLLGDTVAAADVAGPGFINLRLSDRALAMAVMAKPVHSRQGQEILVEFGDANPFKEMHLGHLYTSIVGDSIAHLLEVSGSDVKRLSYHGDVGLHVARAIYGMRQAMNESGGEDLAALTEPLGTYYAAGAKAHEEDEQAKAEIQDINRAVYERNDDLINKLYDFGKQRSFEYFDRIFDELGIVYAKRYFESDSADAGMQYVRDNSGSVFEESDGAVVYRGEKVGLHTRVFITSGGLPTYEAKDLGLAELKAKDFPNASKSIIITANEQAEYFKVMLAALKEISPEVAAATIHLAHGFLSLTSGKMSSRSGHVYSAAELLESVKEAVKQSYPEAAPENKTYLAAVKYALLKNRLGSDIVFDVQESIALEGNSGPYLQYAHARACSILGKVEMAVGNVRDFQGGERSLARKLSEYPEVVEAAASELMPHHICTYLYELAQNFNRFYEHNRVIGDERQRDRLLLVQRYAEVLKQGLGLLGIVAPEHM